MNSDQHQIKRRKKLIEVAIPLEEINKASIREKSIRYSHPSTLHLWWARRPLATARAVIFCQLVDDPSAVPEEFPSLEEQNQEREKLFNLIKDLVKWENTKNISLQDECIAEIKKSWERCCKDNAQHPNAKEFFNPKKLPDFHDPFAGGGTIPMEAKRLGLIAYGSDLNPISVLINKSMIEIPSKFSSLNPVNPKSKFNNQLIQIKKPKLDSFAEDLRYYGNLVKNEAIKKLGSFYPKIKITSKLIESRNDLKDYLDKDLEVISWVWVRTIKSPNPSFSDIYVPLASSFLLSQKKGKVTYVEPIIKERNYFFKVRIGEPENLNKTKNGTKISRGANFRCILSGDIINDKYIKSESKKKNLSSKLMAIVASGKRTKIYLDPSNEHENIAKNSKPNWTPDIQMNTKSKDLLSGRGYGFTHWSSLFTNRQLLGLSTFSDLIKNVIEIINQDGIKSGLNQDKISLRNGGNGAKAYAEAIAVFLSFTISKMADRGSTICSWDSSRDNSRNTFGRQAIPMTWDFAESNFIGNSSGSFDNSIEQIINVLLNCIPSESKGFAFQKDAKSQDISNNKIVSTDPPYYDNITYSDLSDYFYIWLRYCMRDIYPELFSTILVPKEDELIAVSYRHKSKDDAKLFFLDGMTFALKQLSQQSHKAFPITIYYAFKQSETAKDKGQISTGWETFLEAVISSGLSISGTWPMRTELSNRLVGSGKNALASSIVLVCNRKSTKEFSISRNDFRKELRLKFPQEMIALKNSNIAPVDLAQAAIGPGMAIFSQAKSVIKKDDSLMTVGEALIEINSALNEYLSKDDLELDSDTSFALTFFESFGYSERNFGDAEVLAKARNVSVEGIVKAGILKSVGGKVNLIKRENLPQDWDPLKDDRLCVWEATQYLIRTLEIDGEVGASKLLSKLKNIYEKGDLTSNCRSLAYRLFNHCEKNKQADEARSYNSLIISWPEIEKISADKIYESKIQTNLF